MNMYRKKSPSTKIFISTYKARFAVKSVVYAVYSNQKAGHSQPVTATFTITFCKPVTAWEMPSIYIAYIWPLLPRGKCLAMTKYRRSRANTYFTLRIDSPVFLTVFGSTDIIHQIPTVDFCDTNVVLFTLGVMNIYVRSVCLGVFSWL